MAMAAGGERLEICPERIAERLAAMFKIRAPKA
jgi:hypothetical protein